jgi:hypothetical protein
MVFTLALAVTLSIGAAKPSSTFSVSAAHPAGVSCASPSHRTRQSSTLNCLKQLAPPRPLQLVFALVSVGAIVLTVNVVLLGGSIGFFQSLCLLGYCLFPLDAAAAACLLSGSAVVRWVVVPVGIGWASWASVPFIGGAVPANRRALAVYPLCLLYATVGWLALVK